MTEHLLHRLHHPSLQPATVQLMSKADGSIPRIKKWLERPFPRLIYQAHKVGGRDLGLCIASAFNGAFEETGKPVVIVGADIPGVEAKHVIEARKKLGTHDMVIGPAID